MTELLIRFRPGVSEKEAAALLGGRGAQNRVPLRGGSGVERVTFGGGRDLGVTAGELRASPLVEFVEPNFVVTADQVVPNDPLFVRQWPLRSAGREGGAFVSDINTATAWEKTTGSRKTIIAVIDGGVDFTHPDLRKNSYVSRDERPDGRDNDRNSFIDDVRGWDWVTDSNPVGDASGHGTAVAGIIAAKGNNAEGIAGVMWEATLLNLRVLDDAGRGNVADAVEAIDYAVASGAQVINCSWGTPDESRALRGAVERAAKAGVVLIASAGNDGRDIGLAPHYPASFDLPNVIAVGSTDQSEQLADFSNFGAARAFVAAPGVNVVSTKAGGGYGAVSGSSASAPMVSGVAGLVKTLRPRLSAERTRDAILAGVKRVSAPDGKVSAAGLLDAAGALDTLSAIAPDAGGDNKLRTAEAARAAGKLTAVKGAGSVSAPANPPPPVPGAPDTNLPNLDTIRQLQTPVPQAPPPVPSTRCSPSNPFCSGGASLRFPNLWLNSPYATPLGRLLSDQLAFNDTHAAPGRLEQTATHGISDTSFPLLAPQGSSAGDDSLLPTGLSRRSDTGRDPRARAGVFEGARPASNPFAEGYSSGAWLSGALLPAAAPFACTPPTAVNLAISEFRLRGAAGPGDEFVEIYNNSAAPLTVCAADGSAGYALVASDGVARFVIPNGTVINAYGRYLGVGTGYSLAAYGDPDTTYAADVADNTGVALFNSAAPAAFTSANRLDAAGFTQEANALYREGAGLAPISAVNGEVTFYRRLNSGAPQDTADNTADFNFVSATAALNGAAVQLGAPGPEGHGSPIGRSSLVLPIIDGAAGSSSPPNRVRCTTCTGPNAGAGTMVYRRYVTNNTGRVVQAVRIRVVDITTLNSPGYAVGGTQSDLRLITSQDVAVTLTNASTVTAKGTTLEQPPTQPSAGGLNSTLWVPLPAGGLQPGQSVPVEMALGVMQGGSFRYFVILEGSFDTPAAPSGLTATPASPGQVNLAWADNSTNEADFRVERKSAGGAFRHVATVGAGATSYSETGLSSNTAYVYRVVATNDGGKSAPSNEAGATTLNIPPSVQITSPANNASFVAPVNVTVTADASDSDGTVAKVSFFNGASLLSEDTSAPYTHTSTGVPAGSYAVTARATDNLGAVTTSAVVNVHVTLPVVGVAATDASASEPGADTGTFTVSRTGGTASAMTVNFTASGTATGGADYTALAASVTIPAGAASATVVVTPVNDPLVEGNETVTLTLTAVAGSYQLNAAASSASVFIGDDDHGEAFARRYVTWTSAANGADNGNGTFRHTAPSGLATANAVQTLVRGNGYFEATAADYGVILWIAGPNGAYRQIQVGTGGWCAIVEDGVQVAGTSGGGQPLMAHAPGDRYRFEISENTLRYVKYRGTARYVIYTSAGLLPAYPLTLHAQINNPNNEWRHTVVAQNTQNVKWATITGGTDLGNGSVRKTSAEGWDFTATAQERLLAGDGYFESTASAAYHQSINLTGADGAGRSLVFGTGGWAGIYENGVSVADTCCMPAIIPVHTAGTRYRIEVTNGKLSYVLYRGGARTVMYTSTNPLPAYPHTLQLNSSPQNAEWQNTVVAQTSRNTSWQPLTNGTDLGGGSVRKTTAEGWDFTAVAQQRLLAGDGYFESTASAAYHQSINLIGADGTARSLVFGTGGWAGIYENGVSVADTCCMPAIIPVHMAGTRYRVEIAGGALRYVMYRGGARTVMYTSANPLPPYPLSLHLSSSPQNAEWQNTVVADNTHDYNLAAFVSQSVPSAMQPGQTYSVSVTMKNTGTSTWTPERDYRLGSVNPADNQRWGLARVHLTAPVPPSANATFNFNVTAPATPGPYNFQWQMVQERVEWFGAASTNASVTINNTSPAVSITSPAEGASFTAPAAITINANATDPDGSVTKVEFFNGAAKLGEDLSAPYSFTWANVAAGNYALTAKATDNAGAVTTSAVVNISAALPSVAITATDAAAAEAGANTGTFTVSRSGSTASALAVSYAVSGTATNGADYTAIASPVTIPAGASAATVTITPADDAAVETVGETVTLTLSANASYTVGAPAGATVNIADNDTHAPTVSITAPANGAAFDAPSNVTVNANAADSDGTVAKVEFFNGATKLGEDLSSPYSFTWADAPVGSHTLTAKATDNAGATATSAAVAITVRPVVTVTATDASASEPGTDKGTFTFSRTGGTGAALAVSFTVSGTAAGGTDYASTGLGVTIPAGASSASVTVSPIDDAAIESNETVVFTLAAGGSYTVGSPASATVTITDNDTTPPTASITAPAGGAVFHTPATVTINASASDSDGSVAKVEFFQGSTKLGEDTSAPYSYVWSGAPAGSYGLRAVATDNAGATGSSATVNIVVNAPPTVSITSPAGGTAFTSPAGITINASAADSDGSVTKVEFYQGTTKLGEDATAPYSFTWNTVPAGSYALTAKATDNAGAITTSAAVNVTMTFPVITVVANDATASEPGTDTGSFTISRSGSTASSLVVMYSVTGTAMTDQFNSDDDYDSIGGGVTIPAGASSYTLTVRPFDNPAVEPAETVILTLAGSQYYSIGSPNSATVTINDNDTNPPTVSITSPAHQTVVNVGTPITIDAVASDDVMVSKVEFYEGANKLGEDAAAPYSFAWGAVPAGGYLLTARAVDNTGAVGVSSQVQLVVNGPPAVTLTSPAANATFSAGANITLVAEASDEIGYVTKVEFYQGDTKIGEHAPPPYSPTHSFTWNSVPAGTYALTARAFDDRGLTATSAAVTVQVSGSFTGARLDPYNRTGSEDLFSRNYHWSTPLVKLTGRAGLDLGIDLSYNSLVWTKSGSAIQFDADRGFPSPGFRLGFPVIQGPFQRTLGANTTDVYILINTSGARVELRRQGASNVYESADSTYLRLEDNGGSLALLPADGSRLHYVRIAGEYQCTQIKDRHGNYISAEYEGFGRLKSVTDTLGRVVNFVYDAHQNPIKITQTRTVNGQPQEHVWASFGYEDRTVSTAFPGLAVSGAVAGRLVPMLSQVGLGDGSRYTFTYNAWGQVERVTKSAQDAAGQWVQLSYNHYTLAADGTDCPRFTALDVWARDWNKVGGVEQPVTTTYTFEGDMHVVNEADGTQEKVRFAPDGFRRGLVTDTETWGTEQGVHARRKWTTTVWAQDDETLPYPANPRMEVTTVHDSANTRRTVFDYLTPAESPFRLRKKVSEYQGESTLLRYSETDYELGADFVGRRLIGLVREQRLFDGAGGPQSRVSYLYDTPGCVVSQGTPIRHDPAFDTSVKRGLVCSTLRHNVGVVDDDNPASVESKVVYNTAGAPLYTLDPLNHKTSFNYEDRFSAGGDRGTFAYLTAVTDPDQNALPEAQRKKSSVTYDYDTGATTNARDAKGSEQVMKYDAAGRLERMTRRDGVGGVNKGYTRHVYSPSQDYKQTFTLIDVNPANGAAREAYAVEVYDGMGRIRASANDLPGSTGGYGGQHFVFDRLGRPAEQSNQTEMNGAWSASGDDAAGWLYTRQAFDWKGRPTVKTNPDSSTTENSYGGCGCAGGEVITVSGELVEAIPGVSGGFIRQDRRRRKIYHDALGREVKTETFTWENTVYASTVTEYNGRDQVTSVKQYKGAAPENDASCPTGTCQVTTTDYDGHGRVSARKLPQQSAPTAYVYNPDDTVRVETDPRGATSTYTYNNRHLTRGITFGGPGGINSATPVTFDYDEAGNRTSQTDKAGSVSYQYDTLSRLESETRTFSALGSSHTLTYTYNEMDDLTSLTDPTGARIDYDYDGAGSLNRVSGTPYGNVTQYVTGMRYRAWGAVAEMLYGNGLRMDMTYDPRQRVKSYKVQSQNPPPGAGPQAHTDYEYEADGRIRHTFDRTRPDGMFSRLYRYDHLGRLTRAESIPAYFQTMDYDEFDHMTSRGNGSWRHYDTTSSQYLNNRNTRTLTSPMAYPSCCPPQPSFWVYDASGNVTKDHNKEYTYDTAGDKVRVYESVNEGKFTARKLWIYQDYDADGERAKRVEQTQHNLGPFSFVTSYYVRSTVLDGKVVTELDQNGQKRSTFVYANDTILARQQANEVRWMHIDPVTNTSRESTSAGSAIGHTEFDPFGNDVPLEDPEPPEVTPDYEYVGSYNNSGNPYDSSSGCTLDGQPVPCSLAMSLINIGAAAQCPNNNCGPRYNGSEWVFLHLTHSGFSYGKLDPYAGQRGRGKGQPKPPRRRREGGDRRKKKQKPPETILPPNTRTWPDDGGPVTSPISREEAARCDEILRQLFTKQGSGAVAGGSGFNPTTLKNDPKMSLGYNNQSFRAHIWSAMHIWPTNTGEAPDKPVGLYIPEGVGRGDTVLKAAQHGRYDTFYERLGNLQNVTLITSHVGNFRVDLKDRNEKGSLRIGTLAGTGGDSPNNLNVHSHLSIMTSDGRLVSFYDAFCK